MAARSTKPNVLDKLTCPQCWSELLGSSETELRCAAYGHPVELHNGIPVFTRPPDGLVPSKKLARGPKTGTPWRRANWRFLEQQVAKLDPWAVILDVGSGRGDFADVLKSHQTVALDVYPYPEVDVVCDLTQVNPFRANTFDAVVLMNVLEHIYDTHALLSALSGMLKPGGILIVAIPFMVKMHQTPVDFVRYTHYALLRLGEDHGLVAEQIEGYYDPVFFLREGIGNLRWSTLPTLKGWRRFLGRAFVEGLHTLADFLESLLGKGRVDSPEAVKNLAPTGYHVVFRKNLTQVLGE